MTKQAMADAKLTPKYAIFKEEDFNRSGRVVCVGYCVYEVATGERIRSRIPRLAAARMYRDHLNAEPVRGAHWFDDRAAIAKATGSAQ